MAPKALSKPGELKDFVAKVTASKNGRDGVGRIYFAGEAFHPEFSGYTHGAYLSGEDVAKQILRDHEKK